jgi:hypothetical protein
MITAYIVRATINGVLCFLHDDAMRSVNVHSTEVTLFRHKQDAQFVIDSLAHRTAKLCEIVEVTIGAPDSEASSRNSS